MTSQRLESKSGNAFVAIAERARSIRAPVLIACEVLGFASALAIYALVPGHSSFAYPFLSIGAIGLWGTIDHLLESPPRLKSWRRSLLRKFQLAIGLTAIACACATGFVAAGWLMGTFVL